MEEKTLHGTLTILKREIAGVVILDLSGRLLTTNVRSFQETIRCIIREKKYNIILDISGLIYIDAAGLGEIISTQITLKNLDGNLILSSPSQRVINLFRSCLSKNHFVFSENLPSAVELINREK